MTRPAVDPLIEALIDPTRLAVRPRADDERSLARGLALLIDARFADYQRIGSEADWPAFGQAPVPDATPSQRLLSGLSLQLSGAASAAELLVALARDVSAPANVRFVAVILSSIAFRDAARPDLTLDLLSESPIDAPQARAFLLLHLAVSQRELGDPASALDSSLAAEKSLGRRDRNTLLGETLAAVASRNVSAFAFAAGRHEVALARQHLPRARVLDRIESRVASGLSSWLEQEFDGRLEDPSQNTMTFRHEDPVQMPLIAALLRSEVLGDWYLTGEARKRLGRYQLLAALGQSSRQPVPALHQLRRAGDSKAIRQAIRWYRAEGPLKPIQEFGASVAASTWTQVTLQSDLVALAEGADLMTRKSADVALARILTSLDALLAGLPNTRLEGDVVNAVAGLLRVTSGGQDETASRFIDAVSTSNDPLMLQSVTRLLDRIDWGRVREDVQQRWVAYGKEHLIGVDEHRFAAAVLLRALPQRDALRPTVLAAFRRQPDLLTAANALAVGPVSKASALRIARLARDQLSQIRVDAAKGTHGFGAFVDAPLLLTHLLMEYRGVPGWSDLVAFVRDPNVAPSKKVGPLDEILSRPDVVPASVHARLAKWARGAVQYNQLPMDTIDEFRGVLLALRLRYEAKPEQALLADLLELGTSPSRSGRRQAARTLPVAIGRIPTATLITLGLTLSQDSASDVRAAAGSSLAKVAGDAKEPLQALAWQRVNAMLLDPGALVPQAVLAGLSQLGLPELPEELGRVVRDLSKSHESAAVRIAAALVTSAIGLPTIARAVPPRSA